MVDAVRGEATRRDEGGRCFFPAVLAFAVMLALVAGGCSGAKLARRAHSARMELAGLTRAELEHCAGMPVRVQHGAGWEYLTYVAPVAEGRGRSKQCVAIFMLRNGYVESLDYETVSGRLMGRDVAACLPIVERCLPPQG